MASRTSDESGAVYALIHILPRFHIGDRLDGKLEQQHIDTLLEHGDASTEKPDVPEEVLPVPFGVPPKHVEAAQQAAADSTTA